MKKIIFGLLLVTSGLFANDLENEKIKAFRLNQIKQIILEAEKNWPGDYSMQSRVIASQMDSLVQIHKLKLEFFGEEK